jgi:ubiquinone/menaquinone biosynthesis C-methylase UbiE
MISNDMERWLTIDGKQFLTDIGMMPGHIVIDFGCRHGTYTLPAAMRVGKNGRVYAIDKNKNVLNELGRNAKEKRLKNIFTFAAEDIRKLTVSAESVDMVLVYDVLHLIDERKRLLVEFHRVLKPQGILSVYPMHHREKMNMTLHEIRDEIESIGFCFEKMFTTELMHDDYLMNGKILNFKKR